MYTFFKPSVRIRFSCFGTSKELKSKFWRDSLFYLLPTLQFHYLRDKHRNTLTVYFLFLFWGVSITCFYEKYRK